MSGESRSKTSEGVVKDRVLRRPKIDTGTQGPIRYPLSHLFSWMSAQQFLMSKASTKYV